MGLPTQGCGGISGYYHMLDALADPEHPEHPEVTEYLDGWNLKEIKEFPLRITLGRLACRRNAARTRILKKNI